MTLDILIPSCKAPMALIPILRDIAAHTLTPHRVVYSSRSVSAAANRNWCLSRCRSDPAIMIDDDIRQFYQGWEVELLRPLFADSRICAVSARLIRWDGRPGQTCSRDYDTSEPWRIVQPGRHCVMPTAAIAFHPISDIRFDEEFRGSGWEDNDWFFQYRQRGYLFAQSNQCRLVHENEQKGQREHWKHNREYFERKWLKPDAARRD